MTGWRKRQVMEMAREAKLPEAWISDTGVLKWSDLEAFAELVRADEAEKYKWDVHSCGPTCTKVGCVAVRKAVEAEREACAKVCDELIAPDVYSDTDVSMWDVTCIDCAAAIRARGDNHD